MKALWMTTLALASIGRAVAQDIPPLPPTRGDAASLKDTMQFIQDKVSGKVNYMVYGHDNVAETDSSSKRSLQVSNVSADAKICHVGFHWQFDNGDDAGVTDKDDQLLLNKVREIVPMQMDQVIQRVDAMNGHPERSTKVDPPIFLVVVKGEHQGMMFNFYDDILADRVYKALQHAVELCGGGSQEPF